MCLTAWWWSRGWVDGRKWRDRGEARIWKFVVGRAVGDDEERVSVSEAPRWWDVRDGRIDGECMRMRGQQGLLVLLVGPILLLLLHCNRLASSRDLLLLLGDPFAPSSSGVDR